MSLGLSVNSKILVKDYITEIFGKDSLYFDIKPDLRSKAGIGSKPME